MATKNVTALLTKTLKAQVPPSELPVTLRSSPKGNLYEILSRTPSGGVGLKVHQTRWNRKEITDSYWVVSRSVFKREGKNGKAWGSLYWKGKRVSERDERITGALKYTWREGPSLAASIRTKQWEEQQAKATAGASTSTPPPTES